MRDEVERVLAEPSFAARAREIAASIARHGLVGAAGDLIEQLLVPRP